MESQANPGTPSIQTTLNQAPRIIRWGMIGCGDVTEVKSGPGFQLANNSALTAVMCRTPGKARDYANRHQVPRWYEKAEALIQDPEVDAVYIATPPAFHKPYALQVAAAGKPVYVEKPMALNRAECDEMIAACEAAKVPLYVAYYRRALPRFRAIKELLDLGSIGEVHLATSLYTRPVLTGSQQDPASNWRINPDLSGGGLLLDVGSHTLDILDFLLGPVEQVQGHASNLAHAYPAEDTVTGLLTFQSGVQSVASWCFAAATSDDRNEIIGSRGRIVFSTFGSEPVLVETDGGIEHLAIDNPYHIQQPLIQSMVDALNGGPACPSTGVSAARTSRVMDELIKDYYKR